MWVEIFKTGSYKNEGGAPKAFCKADLDEMVRKYDPRVHEAPVAIGPVTDTSPAWAWIKSLKAEGNILYAELKEAVPEFIDMLRKGMFKKRSITLTSSGGLKRINFLGAPPPSIPGLDNIRFSANAACITYDFAEEIFQQGKPSDKLEVLVHCKMNEKPDLSYGEAFSEVQTENPALIMEYIEELSNLA